MCQIKETSESLQTKTGNFNQAPAYQPPVHQGQIYRPQVVQPPAYQAPAYQAPAPQIQGVSKEDFQAYVKANELSCENIGKLKGITTRSGVAYKGPTIHTTSSPKVVEREPEVTKDTMPPTNNGSTEDVQPPVVPVVHHESISEPVNAPLVTDALILMPKFASTLKTLIGNKEKLSEMARTPLNENCSAVILNKLPKKLGDPGRFLIPCEFSRINTCNALADLGASINLMPYSVWKNLSLPELTPTCRETLELADRSISEPIGIAEDVYVTMGKFQFPADFVVVDFEPDPRVPLILGRSFLKTSRALIDVYEEADSFLAIKDDPTSPEVDPTYCDPDGDILLLEAILNSDPSPPPPNQGNYFPETRKDLKICEANNENSS
ncbi:reverse transcriptase domain-containing protein [Tanacetum coccineum]